MTVLGPGLGLFMDPMDQKQGWHFCRQKLVYAICRFKPVLTGKKWQKLAKTKKYHNAMLGHEFEHEAF